LQNDESGEYDASWRWNYDFRANEAASSSSDSSSDFNSEVPPPAPEAHTFFNDALKQKLWAFGTYAAVAGDAAGLTLAVQKLIDLKGNSHGAYVSAFFPLSPTNIQPGHKHSDL
jgi:tetrahydromethanopterin S-methyltransferase subunit E